MTSRRNHSLSGSFDGSKSPNSSLTESKSHHPSRRASAVASYAESSSSESSDINNFKDGQNRPHIHSTRSSRASRAAKISLDDSDESDTNAFNGSINYNDTPNESVNDSIDKSASIDTSTRSSKKVPAHYDIPADNSFQSDEDSFNLSNSRNPNDDSSFTSKRRRSSQSLNSVPRVGSRKRPRIVDDDMDDNQFDSPDIMDQQTPETTPDTQDPGFIGSTVDTLSNSINNDQVPNTSSLTVKLKIGTLGAQSLSTKQAVKSHLFCKLSIPSDFIFI